MATADLSTLAAELEAKAVEVDYSGVVALFDGDRPVLQRASGFANRAEGLEMAMTTRLATASGTKGFTAVTVTSMIEDGLVGYDTPLVEIVGDDLVNLDPAVTIEHLLGHTSGVGDYIDEENVDDIDDHVLDVPVHQLLGPEDYVPTLNRFDQTKRPGQRFAYNNSGYIMLALAIERLADDGYHNEVVKRVFEPAGMTETGFLRSDDLPTGTALGYLKDGRSNVFHLPVIGTGDGGAYTTAADMLLFWSALFGGRMVERSTAARMTEPISGEGPQYYGLGFWVGPDRRTAQLEGLDAGVSLGSGADPDGGLIYCFIANNSSDVWPLLKLIDQWLVGKA